MTGIGFECGINLWGEEKISVYNGGVGESGKMVVAEDELTARRRMVLIANLSVSVYPMIAIDEFY